MKYSILLLLGLVFISMVSAEGTPEEPTTYCDPDLDEEEECGEDNRCCYFPEDTIGVCMTERIIKAYIELDLAIDEAVPGYIEEDTRVWSCDDVAGAVQKYAVSFVACVFALAQLF